MFKTVIDASKKVDELEKERRTPYDVLASLQEEVGELAKEVRIRFGSSYKEPDRDGIVGEVCDCISCLIDLIYVVEPDITEERMKDILKFKMTKWVAKESGQPWNNDYKIEQ